MAVFLFFYEVGTAVWPREFSHFVIPVVKFPWPYRGSYFVKKKKSSDSPRFGLSCGDFAIVNSSLVTWLWLIHRDSRNLRELTRRRPRKISLCHVLINLKNVGVLGATDVV